MRRIALLATMLVACHWDWELRANFRIAVKGTVTTTSPQSPVGV